MTSPSLKTKYNLGNSHDSLLASKKLGSLLRSSIFKSYESIDKREKTNENNENRRKIPKYRINIESQNKKLLPSENIIFKSKDENNPSISLFLKIFY